MDIFGTDISKFPSWAQAIAVVGFIAGSFLIKLFLELRGSSHGSSPEPIATRNDVIEVLTRIAVSNEAIERMMQADVDLARLADKIELTANRERRRREEEEDKIEMTRRWNQRREE